MDQAAVDEARGVCKAWLEDASRGARIPVRTYLSAGLGRDQVRGLMLAALEEQARAMGDAGPAFRSAAGYAIDRAIAAELAALN